MILDSQLPLVNGTTIQSLLQRQFPVFGDRALHIKFVSDYSKIKIYEDMGLNIDTAVSKPIRLMDITQLLDREFGELESRVDKVERVNKINEFKRKEYYDAEKSLDDFF